jgi:beta-lactamase regulating signal transducer with metallopeptidase domain
MASDLVVLLLKLNLAAGAAILVVLALRTAMRRIFGARVAYALWLIVPAAALSVLLPARPIPVQSYFKATATPFQPPPAAADLTGWIEKPISMNVPVDPSSLIALVWLIGAVFALVLLALRQRAFIISLGRLTRERSKPRALRAEVAGIGPALVGAFFPKLLLPSDFETRFDKLERDVVLAHEDVHLRNRDPLTNAFVALVRCFNWFNPLVHVAAHALRIDQELACDAAVIARFPNEKRRYAEAMLKTQLGSTSLPLGCYWPARGEHPLKQRVAMLKRDLPSEFRAAWGAVATGAILVSASVAAWAAQPPVPPSYITPGSATAPAEAELGRQLIKAIDRWDMVQAKYFIEQGADVNYVDMAGGTPLMAAARWDMMWMTRQLLAAGADPNVPAPGNGNALIAAARAGHQDIVRELVKHGADVNAYISNDETPLINAARWGQLRATQALVELGADVNLTVPAQPWLSLSAETRSPLGEAVFYDQRRVAEYLKSKGARM